ncbi:MAG: hypothetical protein DRG82_05485 [Deltaproteobacteria bacterium]|nr:MAG: hypothetical protein B1H13_12710 [Desulfobacteraceae bacterium 4484_190.3]RLB17834.1 MAG: hypothetical protein DRG82_05485 [Deltaproteobacteria bacterium]
MNNEISAYIITIVAFAFFVVCPRLGAMTNLLERNTDFPIYWLVIIGTFASIPMLVLMTWLIRHWGLMAGLGLAIVTDLIAALILTSVSMKVAVETFIIAIFVVGGNQIAKTITAHFFS